LLRQQLAPNSPDPLVAAVAEMNEAVLVSLDSDFRALPPRMAIGRRRFQRLSRIALKCSEPQAAGRINEALSLIEHEWATAQSKSDKRMIVEIGTSVIRTIR
jgi:predicted nuclease of predicted toxin-antitoxin system